MASEKPPPTRLKILIFALIIGLVASSRFSALPADDARRKFLVEENRLQSGIKYIKLGLYTKAIVEFQEILSQNSTDAEAYFQLGHAYQFSERLDDAVDAYQQVLNLPASRKLHGLAHLSLAEVYCKQSQFVTAEKHAKEAIPNCPFVADTYYRLGYVYTHQGKLELAIQEFNKAIELKSDFTEVYQWRGLIALMQNQPEKSVRYYQQAIQRKPFDQSSYYNLAKAYRLLGNLSAAREQLQHFEKIKQYQDRAYWIQKSIDENPSARPMRMKLAEIHLEYENTAAAIAEYQTLLALNPDFVAAYDHLGRIYMQHNQFQEAIPLFQKVLQLDPKAIEPHLRLGWLYANREEFELAKSHLQSAIQKSPNLTLAYHGLAEIYRSQADLEKVAETYHQITQIDPTDTDAWIELGNLHTRTNQVDLAIAAFQEAIEINEKNPYPYERIAWLYVNQGQYEVAEDAIRQAIKRDPQNADYQKRLKQIQNARQVQVK
jgi:tetratricopeptide (TPR) repeat protein